MKKIQRKIVTAILAVGTLISGFSTVGASADECDFQCVSDSGAWLRTSPQVTEENRICVIPTGAEVTFVDIQDGWGQLEYTGADGVTAVGWTKSELYSPVQNMAEQQSVIYRYLTDVLGFSTASAYAVMANIQAESDFCPTAETLDTNGLISYGICQWNGERYEHLKQFCAEQGLNAAETTAQLAFLKYELEGTYAKQYQTMLNFPDNAESCYNAGYYWASEFEICSSAYWQERAEIAKNNYELRRDLL